MLGQIAHARAQLMMRGHEALRVVIGRATLERMNRDCWPYAEQDGRILDMTVEARDDLEGFVVTGSVQQGQEEPCRK